MYFAQYQYLYLLLLVPVILIGYGVLRTFRRKRVRRFGEEELVGALMPSWSGAKGWVRTVLFALAFACFAIGLARPQTGAKLAEHKSKGVEIMVALDVSNSMLSEDYSPNRLERAKLAISRLTDKLQDDRIGLVIFAGTPFVQLPVTTDYVSAKMRASAPRARRAGSSSSSPTARTTRTMPSRPRSRRPSTASASIRSASARPRASPSRWTGNS